MEKPSRYLQALAGEPVHFLGIKAKSFLPLISKAVGQELKMSDFNISDVVPKLRVKLQDSTVLNKNNFALIWILLKFKGNVNTVSLFWGVGPLGAREDGSEELKYLIFVELLSKTFSH